jgi:hypothetical protein
MLLREGRGRGQGAKIDLAPPSPHSHARFSKFFICQIFRFRRGKRTATSANGKGRIAPTTEIWWWSNPSSISAESWHPETASTRRRRLNSHFIAHESDTNNCRAAGSAMRITHRTTVN